MKKKYSHEFSHIDGRIEMQSIKVANTFTKHKGLKIVSKIKFDSIDTLISSIEDCYPETGGHSIRVGYYAGYIAEIFGFDDDYIRAVELAGTLHDVGKLGIPSHILNKKCSLTKEEYMRIQKHPVHTSKILRSMKGFHHISKITLHHHERYDGTGYPEGLKGDNIPFESQIISIADAFDAMTSDRAYRKALTVSNAIDLLKEEAGRQFKPELVLLAIKILPEMHHHIWAKYKLNYQ